MADNTHPDSPSSRKSPKQGASVGSLFSQTLQGVTNTKLNELTKKRNRFEEQRRALLDRVDKVQDPNVSLEALVDGIRKCFSVQSHDGQFIQGSSQNPALEADLKSIERFLGQARFDPCITPAVRDQWRQTLQKHLDTQSLKYSYAALYGQLTTEWLSARQPQAPTEDAEDTEMEDFEHVATARKMEARSNWEETAFAPSGQNQAAIEKMLRASFEPGDEDRAHFGRAMQAVRSAIRNLEAELAGATNFNDETLDWVIKGLLASDLLDNEKREVLRDFQNNDVILNEIADVLNMWITSLDTWTWGDAVGLEQRRQLNGMFTIHMHEDLLQAIFLQYIGVKWSVALKKAFKKHHKGPRLHCAWKSPQKSIPAETRKRRDYFLGMTDGDTVESQREALYRSRYFLAQLQSNETQGLTGTDGEEEADYTNADGVIAAQNRAAPPPAMMQMQQASMPMQAPGQQNVPIRTRTKQIARRSVGQPQDARYRYRATGPVRGGIVGQRLAKRQRYDSPSDSEEESDPSESKNPMDSKQTLLHLLSTEILINVRIHGQMTCVKTHLQDFFSTLPHEAILGTMKFYGASKRWIQFFTRFLQPPLRFLEDHGSVEARLRRRGTPGSHVLSEMFGEAILFALDFQINQSTDGERLWRMHDEFWFWSAKEGICEKAWTTIESFCKTMGLHLDARRSGSAKIGRTPIKSQASYTSLPTGTELPPGQIRWGMLVLNPENGRFEIDESMVDTHIKELSRQLKENSGSVFAWVQAWNTYATTFFTSNFGKPANCFGLQHVDSMLATHKKIQTEIFTPLMESSGSDANVVEYLRQEIDHRFDIKNIPDGYVYFPAELGGLEIRSPFVALMPIRNTIVKQPEKLLDDFESEERTAYRTVKEEFERGDAPQHYAYVDPEYKPADASKFLSFEEFVSFREQLPGAFDNDLGCVFRKLLDRPTEQNITEEGTAQILNALNGITGSPKGILRPWYSMVPYWKWIAQLYGPEIIDQFGGFNIVDPRLLPIGMVGLFRGGRVQWQD